MPNCCPPCAEEMYGAGVDPAALASNTHTVNYRDETDIPCSLANNASLDYVDVFVLPSPSDYDLYRQKWNYVKNLYNAGYRIDGSGDRIDNRDDYFTNGPCSPSDTPNVAYWLDYNKYQEEFYDHLFEWTEYAQNKGSTAAIFEHWLQWRFQSGSNTGSYGNLPKHKRNDHVGHCWMLCPYDSNNTIERTRALLGLADGQFPIEGRNDHGIYYMKTAAKGNVWGFECSSPTCPYLTTYSSIYFYS